MRRIGDDEADLVRLTVRMPVDMHEALREVAYVEMRSMNELTCQAIWDLLTARGDAQRVREQLDERGDLYAERKERLESWERRRT